MLSREWGKFRHPGCFQQFDISRRNVSGERLQFVQFVIADTFRSQFAAEVFQAGFGFAACRVVHFDQIRINPLSRCPDIGGDCGPSNAERTSDEVIETALIRHSFDSVTSVFHNLIKLLPAHTPFRSVLRMQQR